MELKISDNIRQCRKDRGLTQEQLAEALGVTAGAVYKWENALSLPEITTLVELADFFEVSVDHLLGYTVEKGGVDDFLERLYGLMTERKLGEGVREAEKALQKYPNDFRVIYHSAMCYFLMITQDETAAHRCIELLERACQLFDQNPYGHVTLDTLRENIALCYIGLKQYDKSVELLKALNGDGSKNNMIGMVLARYCEKPEEALFYLSAGFHGDLASAMRSVFGFAKAYTLLERYDQAEDVISWMIEAMRWIRDTSVISVLDKFEVVLLALLADVRLRGGKTEIAYSTLRGAWDAARRFDAAPEYRTFMGLKFYCGSREEVSLDDLGDTAILAIENILERDACEETKRIWKEIKDE